jgi:hypothetical protein
MKLTINYRNGNTLEQVVHWVAQQDDILIYQLKNPPILTKIPMTHIDNYIIEEESEEK